MSGLFANRSSHRDFIQNAIESYVKDGMSIFIASAFFTESDVISGFTDRKCDVKIIVRLGFPTNPKALRKILSNDRVKARFYTSSLFHPKIYIFGDSSALVGSANLTHSAITVNQEVMIEVNSEDNRLFELSALFNDYWDGAAVLSEDIVNKYEVIFNQNKQLITSIDDIEDNVSRNIGDIVFANINRGEKKKSKKSIFLDTYSKSYQDSVYAFKQIENVYIKHGRKVNESLVPLRVEVDSFIAFVRDHYATGDTWLDTPVGWNNETEQMLNHLINEWMNTKSTYFENTIVGVNYPLISKTFASSDSIQEASGDEIVEALTVLHSFNHRRRYISGGIESLKKNFLLINNLSDIKRSLSHLLYGKTEIVQRMSDLIFNEYKLQQFGRANIQELIGWVNKEELPVINGRTTKVLRYFGFDVRQLSDK